MIIPVRDNKRVDFKSIFLHLVIFEESYEQKAMQAYMANHGLPVFFYPEDAFSKTGDLELFRKEWRFWNSCLRQDQALPGRTGLSWRSNPQ
jgi:hypothetical protein